VSFPSHTTYNNLKASILSYETETPKNQFHNRINFLEEIESVESMPWDLKSFNISALSAKIGVRMHLSHRDFAKKSG
jgi:hypothetical protein